MNLRVEKFFSLLRKRYEVNIKYKTDSSLMNLLSKILFFIPDFQSRFTTTIGNTIYFTDESKLEKESSLSLVSHEVRHIHDSQLDIFYNIKYLFPQILSLLFFILCFVSLWFLIPAFILLAPLPAYWRMKIELKGYTTTLFVNNLLMEEKNFNFAKRMDLLLENADRINKVFTGISYYFMWIFGVEEELHKSVYKILDGSLEKEDLFYKFIKESFDESKSV